MIEKVRIQGYRKYRDVVFTPNPRFNLVVGANECGKSTLIEAMVLCLTGRVNGRWASEELNPYWFNTQATESFWRDRRAGKAVAWPEIKLEVFLSDNAEVQHLSGAHNSDLPTRACPGMSLAVAPNREYADELEAWAEGRSSRLLPVEYFEVEWRSFADTKLTSRPKELVTALIDSRTVRSSSGVDFHMREILRDQLEPSERAAVSLAYREAKIAMSDGALKSINGRMACDHETLHGRPIGLAMDQTTRTSWEGSVIPHIDDVPLSMSGQGQQAAIKISLSMRRQSDRASYVMIEEPENHLTFAALGVLLDRMEKLAGKHQQLFVTTHSSYVLNRLGLDAVHLVGDGQYTKLAALTDDTVRYFQKLPGYDTLRMALAARIVLVEGPSDEIVFERAFVDLHGCRPLQAGVDVLSVRGLSFARCLELCGALDKTVAVVRDNDGRDPDTLCSELGAWLKDGARQAFIGSPQHGRTLEPQLLHFNGVEDLRTILKLSDKVNVLDWMLREKTESALRLAKHPGTIVAPDYIREAAAFIRG